jgi:hypothetical protein
MENKEVEATETVYGIICVRKGQYNGKDVWFATVGNQCVSRGTYGTKEEVLKLFITLLIHLFSIIYPVHNSVHNFMLNYLHCS